MECNSGDESGWQALITGKEALRTKLEAEGWQVRTVKIDEGCYEAYATTPEGAKVEAYFDPVTLEKLLVARRGVTLWRNKVRSHKPR